MQRKKICLLGAFAVGKTSLVSRFVHGVFDERYQTTIGVKIDKREVEVDGKGVTLVVWDLYGEDRFQRLEASYWRGSHGLLLVVDGTRAWTLDHAREMHARAREIVGDVPHVLLVNKSDLDAEWRVDPAQLADWVEQGSVVLRTSAKTGENVAAAFDALARKMLA